MRTQMRGIGIGTGVVLGHVKRMADPLPEPADQPSARSIDDEKERVASALAKAAALIRSRGARVGSVAADILESQASMVEDPSLSVGIEDRLRLGKTAERAVFEAVAVFRDMLRDLGGYMAERAADLNDVSQRIIAQLMGVSVPGFPESDEPFIIVARDLAPADTAMLDMRKVLALVTQDGGPTSHTAILAREKSIVAVVGVAGALEIAQDETVIVDARAGVVTVQPSDDERARAKTEMSGSSARVKRSLKAGALADGTPISLLANLGSVTELQKAVDSGAEGVGLFRTEFLFLGSNGAPSLSDQQRQYTQLLEAFPGKKVVFRVLDAGADKPLGFLNSATEDNPALGIRGLRVLRTHEHILLDQLAAIAGAAAVTSADVWVMAPMVSTVEEALYFTALTHDAGLPVAGVMVEVPSCALMAPQVLAETDFASIGTNDLTQYTLAADRMLGPLANLQNPWHPSVLRLVDEVGRAGKFLSKPVGVCGEAAADPLLAVVLVGLGVTSLSMSPAAICGVRDELALHTRERAGELAAVALRASDADEARSAVLAALAR
ncbi:MAG: phosphoenolpyruvate--protein phosphotransferase [Microbacteriaceae bacterium]|nr:MAG: phosphoenolpyruvate--protein phosphotransferase [Microbacteriaceae bacterium]